VNELRERITQSEFLEWLQYMDWEETVYRSKTDYYMAQIAAEIFRTVAKDPKTVRTDKFLLKFVTSVQKVARADAIKASKMRWFAITGFKGKVKL